MVNHSFPGELRESDTPNPLDVDVATVTRPFVYVLLTLGRQGPSHCAFLPWFIQPRVNLFISSVGLQPRCWTAKHKQYLLHEQFRPSTLHD